MARKMKKKVNLTKAIANNLEVEQDNALLSEKAEQPLTLATAADKLDYQTDVYINNINNLVHITNEAAEFVKSINIRLQEKNATLAKLIK